MLCTFQIDQQFFKSNSKSFPENTCVYWSYIMLRHWECLGSDADPESQYKSFSNKTSRLLLCKTFRHLKFFFFFTRTVLGWWWKLPGYQVFSGYQILMQDVVCNVTSNESD